MGIFFSILGTSYKYQSISFLIQIWNQAGMQGTFHFSLISINILYAQRKPSAIKYSNYNLQIEIYQQGKSFLVLFCCFTREMYSSSLDAFKLLFLNDLALLVNEIQYTICMSGKYANDVGKRSFVHWI